MSWMFDRGTLLAAFFAAIAGAALAVWWLVPSEPECVGGPSPAPGPARPEAGKEGPIAEPAGAPAPPAPPADAKSAPAAPPGAQRWRVAGKAVDGSGAPLGGVRVALATPWPSTGKPPDPWDACERLGAGLPSAWPAATSAPDGSFALEASRTGRHLLVAGPPEFREAWAEVEFRPAPAPDPAPVTLVLEKGLSVEGRVVDALSGQGVEGVRVMARQDLVDPAGQRRMRRRQVLSAASGLFALSGLDSGPATLQCSVPPGRDLLAPRNEIEAQGGSRDVRIELAPLGRVEFRAVWKDTGEPVDAIASVRAEIPPGEERRWDGFAPSLAREGPGTFVLVARAGPGEYLLSVSGLGGVRARFDVLPRQRSVRPEPVAFPRGPWVEGDLLWWEDPKPRDGEVPPRRAQIYAERLDAPGAVARCTRVPPEKSRTIHFRIPLPEPGRYLLTALSPGCAPEQEEIAVGEGGTEWHAAFEPRDPGAQRPKPRFAFRDRKKARMGLCLEELPLDEALEWISAVSGTDVRLRPGTEIEPDHFVQLQVEDIPLIDVLNLLTGLRGMKIDGETGEIYRDE